MVTAVAPQQRSVSAWRSSTTRWAAGQVIRPEKRSPLSVVACWLDSALCNVTARLTPARTAVEPAGAHRGSDHLLDAVS